MRNTGLKVGHHKASGYRVVECAHRTDLGETLAGLAGTDMPMARRLLRRALRAHGPYGVRLRPPETFLALRLAASGALECEEKAEGTAAQPRWIPWRVRLAPDAILEAKEALGVLDADREREALLVEIDDAVAASGEAAALRSVAMRSPLSVPVGSRCTSRSWSVYSAALRGLAEWDRVRRKGVTPSSREVAARALGSSKAWTKARMRAFEDMSGVAFDEAMQHTEPVVKLRGPIRWTWHGVTGDGLAAHPWLGLPASMVSSFEIIDVSALAVLVVENEKTFETVIRRTALTESVVILFGGGFLGEAEIALLRRLPLPIFVWGDLDPKGIQIVINIAERVGRAVTPVLMEPQLLASQPARPASPSDVALAKALCLGGAGSLAGLAAGIAADRVTVEQEALHEHIDRLPMLIVGGA